MSGIPFTPMGANQSARQSAFHSDAFGGRGSYRASRTTQAARTTRAYKDQLRAAIRAHQQAALYEVKK
jgi:hypothetical protein